MVPSVDRRCVAALETARRTNGLQYQSLCPTAAAAERRLDRSSVDAKPSDHRFAPSLSPTPTVRPAVPSPKRDFS